MKLFGYPDFVRNPRSGRPERNPSWVAQRINNWITGLTAVGIGLLGVLFFVRWGSVDLALFFGPAAVLLLLASWQQVLLNRKIREFKAAEQRYEDGLQKASAELEAQIRSQSTD
jgi:hypothetical protein